MSKKCVYYNITSFYYKSFYFFCKYQDCNGLVDIRLQELKNDEIPKYLVLL